jgi:hypothetical protein
MPEKAEDREVSQRPAFDAIKLFLITTLTKAHLLPTIVDVDPFRDFGAMFWENGA